MLAAFCCTFADSSLSDEHHHKAVQSHQTLLCRTVFLCHLRQGQDPQFLMNRICSEKIIFLSGEEATTFTCVLFSLATEMMHRHDVKPSSIITRSNLGQEAQESSYIPRLSVPSDYVIILFVKKKLLKILLFRSLCEKDWLKLLVAAPTLANFMLCQISKISSWVVWKNGPGMDDFFSASENGSVD